MADGVGLFSITHSNIIGVMLVVTHGKRIGFKDSFPPQDMQSTVFNFHMESTKITESRISIRTIKYYSFMSVTVSSCLFTDTYVIKGYQSGIVSALFSNCTFLGKEYPVGISFIGAQLVIVKDTFIQSYGKFCLRGCSIYMEGSDMMNKKIPGLKEKAEILACPLEKCYFTDSKLLIENTIITGNIYTGASVVYATDLILEMVNCTFNMSRIYEEGGLLYTSSKFRRHYVKMSNVTAIGTSLKKPTILFSLKQGKTLISDVFLLCPQSFSVVVQMRGDFTVLYRCEYSCPNEFYTFDTGEMTIIKDKYYRWSPKKLLVTKSNVSCIPCPVGAYCDKQIKPLPHYWGYITGVQKVTMIRCPVNYCCSGNSNCKQIDSCNTGRIGTLCGSCEHNLTESLFSAKCIPQENCYIYVIFILYFLLVLMYGIGLLIITFLKANIGHIAKYIWKNGKQCFNTRKVENTQLNTSEDKNIELHDITESEDNILVTDKKDTIEPKPSCSDLEHKTTPKNNKAVESLKRTGQSELQCLKEDTSEQGKVQHRAVPECATEAQSKDTDYKSRRHSKLLTVQNYETEVGTGSQDDKSKFESQETVNSKESGMKYLQILFYYVQDAVLFNIKVPVDNFSKTEIFIVKILQFSPDALAIYQNISNICFTYGASAVSKTLMKSVFGPCVMLLLLILYLVLKYSSLLNPSCLSFYNSATTYLIQTFLLVFLMSYQQIITGAFTLVQCIQVHEDKVLYIQGNIQCHTWWQIAIKIFLALNIFPILLVLSHFPFQLKNKKISSKHFLLLCVFPIPVMVYKLSLKFYKKNPVRD